MVKIVESILVIDKLVYQVSYGRTMVYEESELETLIH